MLHMFQKHMHESIEDMLPIHAIVFTVDCIYPRLRSAELLRILSFFSSGRSWSASLISASMAIAFVLFESSVGDFGVFINFFRTVFRIHMNVYVLFFSLRLSYTLDVGYLFFITKEFLPS